MGRSFQGLEGHLGDRRLDAERWIELVLLHGDVRSFQAVLYDGVSGESVSVFLSSCNGGSHDGGREPDLTRRLPPFFLLSFFLLVSTDAHRYLRRPARSHL